MKDTDAFQIRDLGPDEWITEPGFYRLPMDRHHGQPCCDPERLKEIAKGDKPRPGEWAVTSSVLRNILTSTPSVVWDTSLLNPKRRDAGDSDALRLGRVMAAYIEHGPEGVEQFVRVLEGDRQRFTVPEMLDMARRGIEKPEVRPNRPSYDQVLKYYHGLATPAARFAVEFWKEVDEDQREIVSENEWELICDMGKALATDPVASAALDGFPEITMAWYDETTDLWCLARPDQVSFSGLLSDYKKINTQGRPFNERACDARITQHAYGMQMAFAAEAFEYLTGEYPDQVGLVFQHDQPPYPPLLRSIDEENLRIDQFRNQHARRVMRDCMDTGNWWGPGENVGVYRRPEWQREQILEEMQKAGVAP